MRRPWNITNSSVYSLATYHDGRFNMNICTYVTAISRSPKMYAIAIEQNSQTWDFLQQSDIAILQILSKAQTNLIRPLGKRSGKDYDKSAYLNKKNCVTNWNGFTVLKEASAYLLLEKTERIPTGDHDLFCFQAKKYKTLSEGEVLEFSDLIEQKIIL